MNTADPTLVTLARALLDYVFYYPFFMSVVWMCGGLAHAISFELRRLPATPLDLLQGSHPLVTVIVPCFNEGARVEAVVTQLIQSRYPNVEIIAVNDGSTDNTGEVLDGLTGRYPQLRVIHHAVNQGKAVGLNTAAVLARGEFILGVDGDALVDRNAITWLVLHMLQSSQVGAVTGNPRIRTRTTLLGRMQVGEFSSTIGLIKRTQQLTGHLFTLSGVLALFRRKALLDVGFWSTDVMTEDIDVSWKLQLGGWRIRFEPRATCWILMPETLKGLYKQRLRWAMGGIQTLMRYSGQVVFHPRNWRMAPIFIEYVTSVVWAYAMLLVLVLGMVARWLPEPWNRFGFWPEWHGTLLAVTCMLQLLISLWIDRNYDRKVMRYFVWTIWYPIAFWMINMLTTVAALPRTLLRRRGKRALWTTVDRGVMHHHEPPESRLKSLD